MEEQNQSAAPSSANRPMTPKQKLVMWLVIAAIPVGVLIYALANRNSNLAVDSNSQVANQVPADKQSMTPITPAATPSASPTPAETPAVPVATSAYKDGTYSAVGNYVSPGGAEEVKVSLTLKAGIVTASTFEANSPRPMSARFQKQFGEGYKTLVVGKPLADLKLGAVSGSSLTPMGFNDAVAKIQTQAKS